MTTELFARFPELIAETLHSMPNRYLELVMRVYGGAHVHGADDADRLTRLARVYPALVTVTPTPDGPGRLTAISTRAAVSLVAWELDRREREAEAPTEAPTEAAEEEAAPRVWDEPTPRVWCKEDADALVRRYAAALAEQGIRTRLMLFEYQGPEVPMSLAVVAPDQYGAEPQSRLLVGLARMFGEPSAARTEAQTADDQRANVIAMATGYFAAVGVVGATHRMVFHRAFAYAILCETVADPELLEIVRLLLDPSGDLGPMPMLLREHIAKTLKGGA